MQTKRLTRVESVGPKFISMKQLGVCVYGLPYSDERRNYEGVRLLLSG
jgi:hypothetical protein